MMIIELNENFFIDGSDPANWILLKAVAGNKKPKILGYHANVYFALEAAVRHEAASSADRVKLSDLPAWLDGVARRICADIKYHATWKGVPPRGGGVFREKGNLEAIPAA